MGVVSTYGVIATTLTPNYTTIFNQNLIVPGGDTQVIQFQPATAAEYESVVGWLFSFYLSDSEGEGGSQTILTVGNGVTVIDTATPIIQVTLPAGLKSTTSYALQCTSPRLRTLCQGQIMVRHSAAG